MEAHNDSVYRSTLIKAVDFAWNHKRLWLLGIFAGFINSGGVFEILRSSLNDIIGDRFSWSLVADTVAPGGSILLSLKEIILQNNLSSTASLIAWTTAIALIGFGFWFFSLSQGTLIAATDAPGDESLAKRTYDELPLAGSLFLVNLASRGLLGLILVATFFPYESAKTAVGKAAATALSFLIAAPLTVIVMVLAVLTACGIALHRDSILEAAAKSVRLLRKQGFLIIEASLVLFLFAMLFAAGVLLVLRALAVIFTVYDMIAFLVSLDGLSGIFTALFLTLTVTFMVAAWGFLITFTYAAWTALYERMLLGTAVAAFHRHIWHPLKARFAR